MFPRVIFISGMEKRDFSVGYIDISIGKLSLSNIN